MSFEQTAAGTQLLPYAQCFGDADRRVELDGFNLALMRPDPILEVNLHTHEAAHFILHLEGIYLSSAAGAPARATGPILIYNPPGTTHRDRYERVKGAAMGRFLSIAVAADVLPERWRTATDACRLSHPRAFDAAMRVLGLCRTSRDRGSMHAEGYCMELLGTLRERASSEPGGRAWLRHAREVLHDCCPERLTIRDVAVRCGVHPVYLAREFRRHFGMSPGSYLRHCRLARAATLVARGGSTLSAVAAASGFADQSHLTNLFRSVYGVTPGVYRKLLEGPAGS